MKTKVSEKQIKEAVAISTSWSEVMRNLGLSNSGSGISIIKKKVAELKFDTSHFLGCGWRLHKKFPFQKKTLPLEKILVENSSYKSSNNLKKRLIKAGIKKEKCEICNITEWMNQSISFHLDHINGVHNDNRLDNLRILCPNCHSQTPTFGGKNFKRQLNKPKELNHCVDCNSALSGKISLRCKKCFIKKQRKFPDEYCQYKINWPTLEELEKELEILSFRALGRKLGISDNAIRKRIKLYKNQKEIQNYDGVG